MEYGPFGTTSELNVLLPGASADEGRIELNIPDCIVNTPGFTLEERFEGVH